MAPIARNRFTILLAALATLLLGGALLFLSLAGTSTAQAQDDSVPAQPTGLAAEASHNRVNLTWDDPNDGSITHYKVLRRDRDVHDTGEFVTIDSDTDSEDTSYTDSAVEPEKRYVYRVVAVNDNGESKWSTYARANTPAAPQPTPEPMPEPTPEPTSEPTPEPDENSPASGQPIISGTAEVGETLTAETSGISDADGLGNVVYSYQWIANDITTDSEIPSATTDTHTLVGDDKGKTIKVRVTFTDDESNQETLTSEPTASVAQGSGPLAAFTVVDASDQKVVGTLADGGTLALDDPDNGSYGIRADVEAEEEIGSVRLELTGAKDVDQTENFAPYSLYGYDDNGLNGQALPTGEYTLKATAYAERDLGSDILGTLAVSFTATATEEEDQNSPATGAPTISGTAQVGETLTADTSVIDDPDGLDNPGFGYQWVRYDVTTDSNILEAMDSTYTLTEDDAGIAIKLDFTQNPGKVMDDITFVRSHWWLVSEGFSLSTANSDVQKLPATLYHRIADSLAYAALNA